MTHTDTQPDMNLSRTKTSTSPTLMTLFVCVSLLALSVVSNAYGAKSKSKSKSQSKAVVVNNTQAKITVVYPKLNQQIGAIDSTFIFGSVNPNWKLTVNGKKVIVDQDGGWIAFLALESGDFIFNIVAVKDKHSAKVQWPVTVPGIPMSNEEDSLLIFPDYRLPINSRSVTTGEIVNLQFRATPKCLAWAEIVGVADSIPMSEALSIPQPYHAGDVFDTTTSHVDSSLLVPGIYQGLFRLSSSIIKDSVKIVYHMSAQTLSTSKSKSAGKGFRGVDIEALKAINWRLAKQSNIPHSDTSAITLTLNSQDYPRTIEFTDTTQRLRVAPARGYLGLFQPAGVRALAVGFDGDWYRLQLSESRVGYVEFSKAKALEPGIFSLSSRLSSFRCELADRQLSISAQLSGKHPFSITQPDNRTMVVELFGVTMDTDWFRFDYRDTILTSVSWTQPEPNLFRLELRFATPIWGYSATYSGPKFDLKINYPPHNLNSLHGKTIVIDPGHHPDPGAIGPTGLTEAEANMAISLILRSDLERLGAKVVLTREGEEGIELYGRPKVADSVDADLFVSVHNNALPDGVNPFVNYGVSTFFYHIHSQALARSIHEKMIALPNQKDHGFYHGNLAVIRPTERPSALVECGFMILPEQERWLKDKSYHKRVAHAIAQGIEQFFKNYGEDK